MQMLRPLGHAALMACLLMAASPVASLAADAEPAVEPAAEPAGEVDPIRVEFDQRDLDHDGGVTQDEMYEYLRAHIAVEQLDDARLNAMVTQTFGMIDADGDGFVTFAEYQAKTKLRRRRTGVPGRDLRLFEARFGQSSYNAMASVLIHFYGPTPIFKDAEEFEQRTFFAPLEAAGFADYFGWGPWTGYMVGDGKLVWNRPVTDLKAERFALRPTELPAANAEAKTITVKYAQGERAKLEARLNEQLKRGPVIMWVPYAAAMTADADLRWRHVKHIDDDADVVPFGPFTRSVALIARDEGRILVLDGSVPEGAFYTDSRTAVATAAAMTAAIRLDDPESGRVVDRIAGIEDDAYNVVFWRQADPDAKAGAGESLLPPAPDDAP